MTVATITEMRNALASVIVVDGLRTSPYMPEKPAAPIAIVEGPEVDFNEDTMSDNYSFPVRVLVSDATQRAASLSLDGFLPLIRQSIEANPTLSGVVQYALVVGIREYGTHLVQNVEYLGATLLVTVIAYRQMS